MPIEICRAASLSASMMRGIVCGLTCCVVPLRPRPASIVPRSLNTGAPTASGDCEKAPAPPAVDAVALAAAVDADVT